MGIPYSTFTHSSPALKDLWGICPDRRVGGGLVRLSGRLPEGPGGSGAVTSIVAFTGGQDLGRVCRPVWPINQVKFGGQKEVG